VFVAFNGLFTLRYVNFNSTQKKSEADEKEPKSGRKDKKSADGKSAEPSKTPEKEEVEAKGAEEEESFSDSDEPAVVLVKPPSFFEATTTPSPKTPESVRIDDLMRLLFRLSHPSMFYSSALYM